MTTTKHNAEDRDLLATHGLMGHPWVTIGGAAGARTVVCETLSIESALRHSTGKIDRTIWGRSARHGWEAHHEYRAS